MNDLNTTAQDGADTCSLDASSSLDARIQKSRDLAEHIRRVELPQLLRTGYHETEHAERLAREAAWAGHVVTIVSDGAAVKVLRSAQDYAPVTRSEARERYPRLISMLVCIAHLSRSEAAQTISAYTQGHAYSGEAQMHFMGGRPFQIADVIRRAFKERHACAHWTRYWKAEH